MDTSKEVIRAGFYKSDALSVTKPIVAKQRREIAKINKKYLATKLN